MGPDENVKLGPGTIHINDTYFTGPVTDYDYDDYDEDVMDYLKKSAVLNYSDSGELSFTWRLSKVIMLKLMGIWDWVTENCPNPRVKHLIKHGKNHRVRYKNFKRAVRLIGKNVKEK